MYICKRCGKDNKFKSRLIEHLQSKRLCYPSLSDIDRNIIINNLNEDTTVKIVDNLKYYVCKYCKKHYKSASSKCNHQQNCKFKNYMNTTYDISNNILNNNYNTTSNNINNSMVNSQVNITTNDYSNNNQNIFNLNDVNQVNALLKYHDINSILSFPTYSIGCLVENNGKLLKKHIEKSRIEDNNPSTSYKSDYNFVMNILKEILSSSDLRTKNMYINNISDNIAYCMIDNKFYAIELDTLFKIMFNHIPNLILHLIKIKDKFNGVSFKDKKYAKDACVNFTEFLKQDNQTEFKNMIIECIFNNKKALEELLKSAKPHELLDNNNNELRTINFNSHETNRLRTKIGARPFNSDITESIHLETKPLKIKFKSSIKSNETNANTLENEIEIDYDNTDNKYFSDGKICYRTKYKGIDIWYNENHNVGVPCSFKKTRLYPKKKLIKLIDFMINVNNGELTDSETETETYLELDSDSE